MDVTGRGQKSKTKSKFECRFVSYEYANKKMHRFGAIMMKKLSRPLNLRQSKLKRVR